MSGVSDRPPFLPPVSINQRHDAADHRQLSDSKAARMSDSRPFA